MEQRGHAQEATSLRCNRSIEQKVADKKQAISDLFNTSDTSSDDAENYGEQVPCLALPSLALSCLVMSCFVLFCLAFPGLVLFCRVFSCLVLSLCCLVLSSLV